MNGVFELLPEFKGRFTIQIVHCSHGRLLPRDDDELLAVLGPLHILNLVIKHRDKFPIFPFVNSNVLEGVLTVIAFARRVGLVLRPDEDRVARRCWNYQNIICPRTSDVELWPLEITVQIIYVYEAVVFRFREDFPILPGHQIARGIV